MRFFVVVSLAVLLVCACVHAARAFGNPGRYHPSRAASPAPIVVLEDDALLPTLIDDAEGDQEPGPPYGDCLEAGVTNAHGAIVVAQRIHGTFPPEPRGDVECWSWRFDTDLNTNTGYQQFWYIGIDWEILVHAGEKGWGVSKWSPDEGYAPLAGARILLRHAEGGDVIGIAFDPAEIGAPPYMNWIAWNGGPGWQDVAPEESVAWWER